MSPRPRLAEEGATLVQVRADLDVPGETGRQARVFALWLVCLGLALVLGAFARPRIPPADEGSTWAADETARSRIARLEIAGLVGLLLPSLLTMALTYFYRRGGGHAAGIVADVTSDGELRLWGRGYGSRVLLRGAEVHERLVDVYAGRLGAWRQRRLRVRATGVPTGGRVLEIELATTATEADVAEGLRAEGGEGNCVELDRRDYERLRAAVLAEAGRPA